MRILITGNIASGKTTISKMICKSLGESYVYINADDWFNQNRLIDPVLRDAATSSFGTLDKDNIKALLLQCNKDNHLMNRYFGSVADRFDKYLRSVMNKYMVVECASFFESEELLHTRDIFDLVISVEPGPLTFAKNATDRGLTDKERNFFNTIQMPQQLKNAMSDITFVNDRENTESCVKNLASYIKSYDKISNTIHSMKLTYDIPQLMHLVKCLLLNSHNDKLAYHNINHVREMLVEYYRMGSSGAVTDTTMVIAIVMHDMDYNPSKHNNEITAARIVEYLNIPRLMKNDIKRIIMSTVAGHVCTGADEMIMHDLDWAAFGKPCKEYMEYANAIRSEFEPIVGTKKFLFERIKFLDKFERSDIFYNANEQKRQNTYLNMSKELDQLKYEAAEVISTCESEDDKFFKELK